MGLTLRWWIVRIKVLPTSRSNMLQQEANCSASIVPPPAVCRSQCKLLGGTFSVLVQCCLAFLCLGVLLIKRWREYPRRPWVIWIFDLSKQVFSSGLQHGANLLFGHILAHGGQASE